MDTIKRALDAFTSHTITVVAVIFCLFHLYTSATGPLTAIEQRVIHLTFGLMMVFLATAPRKHADGLWKLADWLFCLGALAAGTYLYVFADDIAFRLGIPNQGDLISGAVVIILLLEATRRVLGWPLPIIALAALLYGFLGNHLPGVLAHSGFDTGRIISHLTLTTEGIFTVPLGVSATVVVIFIIFATFLNSTGVGQYFIDVVMASFGRSRGGPAKAAVIGSAMMGTLTGSVIANVMSTGTFTIPLMKNAGYKPEVAGAVEACTSTGGQIMPPVMGAAAFIIAEFLQVPYLEVIKAALMPAILYYVALFVFVDLEAARAGLAGLSKQEVQQYREGKQGKYYLLAPLVLLLILMILLRWSPMRSAFFAAMLTLAIGFLRRQGRLNLRALIQMFEKAGRAMLEVVTACACAGIVIGMLSLTGLGLQLSNILTTLAGGNLLLLLVLTMLVSLVLGMGLTTTACYVILAVLVAPALVKMGVEPMAAHMFVFYYGMYSFITPPVALGAYAASGLSGSPPLYTGYVAWKIALPGFILPFIFVYWPALLLNGSWGQISQVTVTAIFGVLFLSVAIAGFFKRKLRLWERALMTVAGAALVHGSLITDIIGFGLGVAIMAASHLMVKKQAKLKSA
jgi:TRAP transporter 4TM/12TM fusion protein